MFLFEQGSFPRGFCTKVKKASFVDSAWTSMDATGRGGMCYGGRSMSGQARLAPCPKQHRQYSMLAAESMTCTVLHGVILTAHSTPELHLSACKHLTGKLNNTRQEGGRGKA